MIGKRTVTRSQEYAESIINTVREPLIVLDHDLRVVSASRSFYEVFKVNPEETVGQLIYTLGDKQWDIPKLRELLETILPEKTTFDNYEVEHDFATIGNRIMLLNARQIKRVFGKERIILLAIEDITERKRLEDLLIDSEERYRRLFETASDGIVLLEKQEGKITQANPATEKLLGYTEKESIGNKLQDIGVELDMSDFQTTMQNLNKQGIINYRNVKVENKSGQQIDTEIYLVDRAKLVQCNIRDITERKRAQKALRESEEKYRWVLDNMADVIAVMDMNLRFTYVSPSIMRMRGYTAEGAAAQTFEQVMTPESLKIMARVFEEEMNLEASGTADPGRSRILELEQYRKDGSIVLMENHLSFLRDETQKAVGIISLSHDITDRKRAEEALRESEEKYRTVVDFTYDWEYWLTPDRKYIYVSPACERISGYRFEEFQQDPNLMEKIIHPDDKHMFAAHIHDVLHGISGACELEFRIVTRGGKECWIGHRCQSVYSPKGEYLGQRGSNRDITDRKRAETNLKESKELTEAVVENVPLMIFLKKAVDLRFVIFNRAGEELLGYDRKVLLGKNNLDLFPPEQAAYFMAKDREVLDGESGILDIPEEPILTANKGQRLLHTRKVCIRGADGATKYLLGISEDITERKLAEEKLKDTLDRLKRAVNTTIQVIVSAIEVRDPYTSGHQIRVANLANVIAMEMRLPQDKIDGIRMAGTIHDLGKLSIPAEILSKPTKLTNIEFALIKEHAQKGYEMLKDVESPWPLAEIVYQHHERMDGSGYPRKLKGEEIYIEARILSVADVVEAMASHRPYRASLGLEAALEEIEKNSGLFYDNAVVDACLRLFREKGFQLLS